MHIMSIFSVSHDVFNSFCCKDMLYAKWLIRVFYKIFMFSILTCLKLSCLAKNRCKLLGRDKVNHGMKNLHVRPHVLFLYLLCCQILFLVAVYWFTIKFCLFQVFTGLLSNFVCFSCLLVYYQILFVSAVYWFTIKFCLFQVLTCLLSNFVCFSCLLVYYQILFVSAIYWFTSPSQRVVAVRSPREW